MPLGEVAQSYLHPLRFPPQQHKLSPGIAVDPVTQRGFEIPRIDEAAGLVWLKRGQASVNRPLPSALIPAKPIPQTAQQAALRALAEQATGQITGPSPAFELLLRMPPRLRGDVARRARRAPRRLGAVHPGAARLGQDLHGRAADLRAAAPAGAGSASRRRRTRRSTTCSTRSSARAAEAGVAFRGLQEVRRRQPRVALRERARDAPPPTRRAFPPADDVTLIAGTAWLWAREELRGAVDVLFVDEAGQMSLADALAIAGAGRGHSCCSATRSSSRT